MEGIRKNVLVAEMLYPEGHKTLNRAFLSILSELADITLIDDGKYFDDDVICTKRIKTYAWMPKHLEILISIAHFINLLLIAFITRKYKFDKIIFLSVRNDAMYFALPFFKSPIAVFHHNDIDRIMERPIEKWLFKKCANKIEHIVLADFIKEGLVNELSVNKEMIHLVYQPLINSNINDNLPGYYDNYKYVIGLGRSTEESFLKEAIELDKKWKGITNYKIILRSKRIDYKSDRLIITSEIYPRDVFERVLSNSSACVVIYKNTFKLRYSGIIDDALSYGKYVIGNNLPVVSYFEKKYSGCCCHINNVEDLFRLVSSKIPEINKNNINQFRYLHSKENVKKQFLQVL